MESVKECRVTNEKEPVSATIVCEPCWQYLVKAIATRRAHDSEFRRVIASYHHQAKGGDPNAFDNDPREYLIDDVSKLAFSEGTWLLALAIGEASEPATARYVSPKLTKLKSDILGYHRHIDQYVYFFDSMLDNVSIYTKKLLQDTENMEPVKSITTQLHDLRFNTLAIRFTLLFPGIRQVGMSFKHCAEKLSAGKTKTDPKIILAEAKFVYTAYAVKHLSVSSCMSPIRDSGFIDGSDPKSSYIYKCMKKLAKRNGYECLGSLLRFSFSSAIELAKYIDDHDDYYLGYRVVDVVSFVSAVLHNVVSGVLIGEVYTPPQSMYEDQYFDCSNVVANDEEGCVPRPPEPEQLRDVSTLLGEFEASTSTSELVRYNECDYRFMCRVREFQQSLLTRRQASRLERN